jgi:hypothetical protein
MCSKLNMLERLSREVCRPFVAEFPFLVVLPSKQHPMTRTHDEEQRRQQGGDDVAKATQHQEPAPSASKEKTSSSSAARSAPR